MASSRNNALEFSSVGSTILNAATGTASGTFGAIQFLKDSELDEVIATNAENYSDLQTTYGAGTVLYGNFISVTVTGANSLAQLHKV